MIGPLPSLATSNPVEHVIDKPIHGQWYVSNVTVMLLLSALLTALIVIPVARRIARSLVKPAGQRTLEDLRVQGLWANLVESICVYLRDQVFRPVLQEHTDTYTPILWTFFWFILIANLLGLVPLLDLTALVGLNHGHGIGGTATQSIWVTGALAGFAFLYWNYVALTQDWKSWFKHLTGGSPLPMWPIMVLVEFIGMFVKPFALALRLFANMTGGHILLAVLLGFVASLIGALGVAGYGLALIPLLGSVAINLLEVMVAFIQAFIFTFLTCLFLGQLIVHEHEDHAQTHEAHPHAAGVDPHEVMQAHDLPAPHPAAVARS